MRWIWIDRIVALEKGVRCVAVKNVSLAEEQLHDHFPAEGERGALPIMPAPLIIEGMAQTAGILAGHARDFAENVILAKIGGARFDREVTPGQTLLYTATLDRIDDSGASTSGTIDVIDHPSGRREPETIGNVELMFSHVAPDRPGLELPADNFVFTDQFMDLMRNSGFA